jgi:hypothetical protein
VFRHAVIAVALVGVLAAAAFASAGGDTLSYELKVLAPLVGHTWVGYYSDDEDREMQHVIEWTTVLGGRAVRGSKQVEAANFEMDRLYYWDPNVSRVAFLAVTNRGQVSTGTVGTRGDTIELLGDDHTEDGLRPFRYTFHLTDEGVLEDRFFRGHEGGWQPGHLIVYRDQAAGAGPPRDDME